MNAARRPSVAAIGMVSWDRMLVVDDYPAAGGYAIVRQTLEGPGGTTGNTAAALARLGVRVTLAALVGDDREGAELRDGLAAEGCDVAHVTVRPGEPTDVGVIVVSGQGDSVDRTIFWQQGHDYLCGNERELRCITGQPTLDDALRTLQARMALDQLRLAFISRGPAGSLVVSSNSVQAIPPFQVAVVDTTGAGDAFTAGVALGLLERRPPAEIGRLGNAMGALAVRALGARASLPGRDELERLLASV
jgi:sugar/nucleoside kinase (ribokinase family)